MWPTIGMAAVWAGTVILAALAGWGVGSSWAFRKGARWGREHPLPWDGSTDRRAEVPSRGRHQRQ